ncbi:hypothetical protein AB4Y43_08290 [Paraburkholderia sp. BR10872]|uniref:hypothetical protein n=1 Tax=Paraburkholderia sp. BR10872 TaxID=3236989 RepID=UPI0034D2C46C
MVLAHIWSIATGTCAGLALIVWLYALCIALTPSRLHSAVRSVPHAVVIGASLAVMWFWYSLKFHIPGSTAAKVLFVFTIILLLSRYKAISRFFDPKIVINRDSLSWVGLYVIFYSVNYLFLIPPVTHDLLPISGIGNNDIFNYIIISQRLQHLGSLSGAGLRFVDPFSTVVPFTPSAFNIINGFAVFFNAETMRAAMPAIFAMAALASCTTVWIAGRYFQIPRLLAAGVGIVFVSGPFLRYIVGNYFLSSIVAEFFVLLLLGKTAELVFSTNQRKWTNLVCIFAPYHFLLFFSYPPLYVIGTGLQVCFVLLSLILFSSNKQASSNSWLMRARISSKWIMAIAASSLIPMILDPQHTRRMLQLLFFISQPGVAGWPLDFIAPAAIMGLPTSIEIHSRHAQINNIIISATLFVIVFFATRAGKPLKGGRVFLLLSGLSFLLYFAYFLRSGSSYQQWKIASYIPLFLAPFFLSSVASAISEQDGMSRRLSHLFIFCLGLVIAGKNMAFHCNVERTPKEFPASYANLRALDMLGGIKEIYIEMSTYSSTFFPVYYLQSKTLHLLSPSYYSQETFSPQKITATTPLFIEGDACDAKAYSVTIAGVGCLHFQTPGLELNIHYPFSKKISALFVKYGLSFVEPWGRWSDGKHLKMSMLMDGGIAGADNVRYLNLNVVPFVTPTSGVQDVTAIWGRGKKSETNVREQEWISIPFRKSDLSGFQNRELVLELELPGAISPHSVESTSEDKRQLGLGFNDLSITEVPLGSVI